MILPDRKRSLAIIAIFVIGLFGLLAAGYSIITRNRPLADTTNTPSITISPLIETKNTNDTFDVNFKLNSPDKPISVAIVDVTYSDTLEYEGFSTANTVFDTAIKDPAPSSNHFNFQRTRFTSGFQGNDGLIATVTFKAKKAGQSFVRINQTDSAAIEYSDNPQDLLNSIGSATFTVVDPTPSNPTISDITPSTGPVDGQTPIVITGTNFRDGAKVKVGDADCNSVSYQSATKLTCVTPQHTQGSVDIAVTNTDQTSVTKSSAFSYTAIHASSNSTSNTTSNNSSPNTTPTNSASGSTKPKPVAKTTPAPAPVSNTNTSAIAIDKSTITLNSPCVLSDSHDLAIIQLALRDSGNNLLKDPSYKPSISVSDKTGLLGLIRQTADGLWLIAIKSSVNVNLIVNISSHGTFLGVQNITFASNCNADANATTDTTAAPDSVTTTPATSTPQSKAQNNLSKIITYAGVGLIALALAGGGVFLFIRKRSQNS